MAPAMQLDHGFAAAGTGFEHHFAEHQIQAVHVSVGSKARA